MRLKISNQKSRNRVFVPLCIPQFYNIFIGICNEDRVFSVTQANILKNILRINDRLRFKTEQMKCVTALTVTPQQNVLREREPRRDVTEKKINKTNENKNSECGEKSKVVKDTIQG